MYRTASRRSDFAALMPAGAVGDDSAEVAVAVPIPAGVLIHLTAARLGQDCCFE